MGLEKVVRFLKVAREVLIVGLLVALGIGVILIPVTVTRNQNAGNAALLEQVLVNQKLAMRSQETQGQLVRDATTSVVDAVSCVLLIEPQDRESIDIQRCVDRAFNRLEEKNGG